MTPDTYAALSAQEIAAGVASGAMRPTEIVEAALGLIDTLDPVLHAFTHVAADAARARARDLENALAHGMPPGPLCGVPVAVKDLICTRDMPTTFGSRLYDGYQPPEDDICVARLRAAGAILIGKTNCSEFGYGGVGHNPLFPTTRNPWNPDLTPGGSSAGSAVAVATGICPVALGSDGGGSIRIPAAFTGIVGMKASMGRVPLWPGCRDPALPGASSWESIEHIGPLARSVADCALVLSVIAGPDARDRHSIPSDPRDWLAAPSAPIPPGLRVAYCETWAGVPVDPEVAEVSRTACARLCEAIKADLLVRDPPDIPLALFRAVVTRDTDVAGLRRLYQTCQVAPTKALALLLEAGQEPPVTGMERMRAVNALAAFTADFDLIVTPATACLPFAVDRDGPSHIDGQAVADDAWSPAAFPFNLTGQPAISVAAGLSRSGLPIGLQIAGPHLCDTSVLSAAARVAPASLPLERSRLQFTS